MNKREDIHHEGDKNFHAINVGCMWSYMDYEPQSLEELLLKKKINIADSSCVNK